MASVDRRARERAETREKILAAARRLFVEEGFEAVTLRRIAAAIEYTAPALYSHFADKQGLMLALCDADFALLRQAFARTEKIADPVERLRAVGRTYVKVAIEHPHHYRFMFMTAHPLDPAQSKIQKGNPDEDAYAFLRATVAACIAADRFGAEYRDAEMVTQMCWGASHGVVSLYLTHSEDCWISWKNPVKTAYALVDAVVDGLVDGPVNGLVGAERPRAAVERLLVKRPRAVARSKSALKAATSGSRAASPGSRRRG